MQNGLWSASSTYKPFHSFQTISYSSSRKLWRSLQIQLNFLGVQIPNFMFFRLIIQILFFKSSVLYFPHSNHQILPILPLQCFLSFNISFLFSELQYTLFSGYNSTNMALGIVDTVLHPTALGRSISLNDFVNCIPPPNLWCGSCSLTIKSSIWSNGFPFPVFI